MSECVWPAGASPKCVDFGAGVPLERFEWLGFDLDHALCRYRNPALLKLIYDCLRAALITQAGYPAAALSREWSPSLAQKGIIADFHTGDLLKLDAHGRVRQAYHGFRSRTHHEIEQVYGTGTWSGWELLRSRSRHHSFYTMVTFFDISCQPLIAQLVEYADAQAAATASSEQTRAHAGHAYVSVAMAVHGEAYDKLALEPRYAKVRRDVNAAFDHIYDNVHAYASMSSRCSHADSHTHNCTRLCVCNQPCPPPPRCLCSQLL
ncbi:hypothetical protein EON62_00500 [archaeon]|nr:MAG: hypothetical protein EON62_00500 [archaeon]